jgi:hypothetical protein
MLILSSKKHKAKLVNKEYGEYFVDDTKATTSNHIVTGKVICSGLQLREAELCSICHGKQIKTQMT